MKKYFFILIVLALSASVYAADPPRLSDYKTKLEASLSYSCSAIHSMYLTAPVTLNLSAVYYDGPKVLYELYDLYGSSSINGYDISTCIDEGVYCITSRYISTYPNEGGYTRFPHGIAYDYLSTGNSDALSAFEAIRDGTNWDDAQTAAHEQIIYSREVAYALQTYTIAQLIGQPHASQAATIAWYRDLCKSHLQQWISGDFYAPIETNDYMQSFMVGLTMAALIEYYEYIEQDAEIPPLIKSAIDLLWAQAWWPDIHDPYPSTVGDTCNYLTSYPDGGGHGAFWYWLNWNETDQDYDYDADHLGSSCDVNADTNMLVGKAYAWYSMYSGETSDTDTYMARAVDIWEGSIQNSYYGNDGRHQWEASRYNADFIRYYRKVTGSTCSAGTLDMCESESTCETAGGNWTGWMCVEWSIYASSTAPTVDAGLNQSISVNYATASGTYSVELGRTVASCIWSSSNGESGTLTAADNTITGTMSGLAYGTVHTITITVTDSEAESGSDTVQITVGSAPESGSGIITISNSGTVMPISNSGTVMTIGN